jgi:hypothetical protein
LTNLSNYKDFGVKHLPYGLTALENLTEVQKKFHSLKRVNTLIEEANGIRETGYVQYLNYFVCRTRVGIMRVFYVHGSVHHKSIL